MFGMGFSEIMIILVIGIIFLGPEKLPEAMVKIAKFFNAFKRTINEAKESIDQELKIEELKKEALEYKKKLHDTTNSISSMYKDDFEEIKNSTTSVNDLINSSIEEAADATKESSKDTKKPKTPKKKKKKRESEIEKSETTQQVEKKEDDNV